MPAYTPYSSLQKVEYTCFDKIDSTCPEKSKEQILQRRYTVRC